MHNCPGPCNKLLAANIDILMELRVKLYQVSDSHRGLENGRLPVGRGSGNHASTVVKKRKLTARKVRNIFISLLSDYNLRKDPTHESGPALQIWAKNNGPFSLIKCCICFVF